MLSAQALVEHLLDERKLPGMSPEELDRVMQIIYGVVDRVKSGRPEVDVPTFEREANQLLEPYGVRFARQDFFLDTYPGAPARCGIDGIVFRTPRSINRNSFDSVRLVLSHEAVHQDQGNRAINQGRGKSWLDSGWKHIAPKGVPLPQRAAQNKQELAAFARTAVDYARQRRMTREQFMQQLRRNPASMHHGGSMLRPDDIKRFARYASEYAAELLP